MEGDWDGPVLDALRGTADWLLAPERLNPQAGALAPLLPALAGPSSGGTPCQPDCQ